jgi:hypothetical protein
MDRKQGEAAIKPNVLSESGSPRPAEVRPNRLAHALGRPARAAALPRVSTRWTGVVLIVCLVVAAVALPMILHRSAWIEAEIVLLAWFVTWTVILAWLGYSGRRLVDDGPIPVPWQRGTRKARVQRDVIPDPAADPAAATAGFAPAGTSSSWRSSDTSWADYLTLPSISLPDSGDGDDLVGAIVAIVLVVVAVIAIAAVTAIVLPILLALLYAAVRLMLGRVADEPDATRGHLATSIGRGVLWAAVFTGPLALGVWLIHVVL